ncbi:class I SAM-dependent methyltransferase [Shimazuella sp. AN120528]|nr:class I SAM-dependent methyltransferase [Shimazuella soli]
MGSHTEPIMTEYYNFYANNPTDMDQDIHYYVELAKQTGGPVIELGCGTGRMSIAIAKEGIEVVGVDFSAEKLAVAKQKSDDLGLSHRIKWVESSITNFQLPETFPLIIMPDRSFLQLINIRDQLSALKAIRRHLEEGGLFAFHAFVPHMRKLIDMEGKYTFRGSFPSGNDEMEVYDFTELDTFNQIANITRYIERFNSRGKSVSRTKSKIRLRYIFPAELSHLLAVCGFKIENRYGSFYRAPFDANSEELIVEAVKLARR